ncbi:hypothetical protein [Halorubrum saccharovorum]|uniref:hypothetical protein n=1 Tax=Halorubrum saccharovorum TaxID=2248 RepID=UPI0004D86357|nr:hypothetical protein [Halorubrum saccharovorum]
MVPDDRPSTDDVASPDAHSPDASGTASNDFLAPGDDAPADLVDVLVYGLAAAYTLGSGIVGGLLGHYLRGRL